MSSKQNMVIDVVDDINRKSGTIRRSEVLSRGANFRTVHVLLFCGENLALQKLPLDHPRSPGLMGSSVAGYLKSGETYLHAAKRKMQAEIHQIVNISRCCQFEMQDQDSKKFVTVYSGKINEIKSYNRDEIDEIIYINDKEIPELIIEKAERFTPTFLEVFTHYKNTTQN